MGIGSQDRLFGESVVERLDVRDGGRIDANGGTRKHLKSFEPDAVMLVPPSLDEWLPQNHVVRFIAEIIDGELDLARFYDSYAKAKG